MSDPAPTMRRVCCMCGVDLGRIPCAPEQADKVSHGYCPACAEAEKKRLGLVQCTWCAHWIMPAGRLCLDCQRPTSGEPIEGGCTSCGHPNHHSSFGPERCAWVVRVQGAEYSTCPCNACECPSCWCARCQAVRPCPCDAEDTVLDKGDKDLDARRDHE